MRQQQLPVLVELDDFDDGLLDPSRARHEVANCTPFSALQFRT